VRIGQIDPICAMNYLVTPLDHLLNVHQIPFNRCEFKTERFKEIRYVSKTLPQQTVDAMEKLNDRIDSVQ
jgi:hypothetical protein